MKLADVFSVDALRFHSLVAASERLCVFRMQLKDFSTTWAGVHGNFSASAMSTVSSTYFMKVPKGSVASKGQLKTSSTFSYSRNDASPHLS